MAFWMLWAVSKLRIGSGVSMADSAFIVFSSGLRSALRELRARISQIDSSSARASPGIASAAPRAATEERSLRRFKNMQSPVSREEAAKAEIHPRPIHHNVLNEL
jgi:hypothetical protein